MRRGCWRRRRRRRVIARHPCTHAAGSSAGSIAASCRSRGEERTAPKNPAEAAGGPGGVAGLPGMAARASRAPNELAPTTIACAIASAALLAATVGVRIRRVDGKKPRGVHRYRWVHLPPTPPEHRLLVGVKRTC